MIDPWAMYQDLLGRLFRPTCPRCSVICAPDARYCAECGTYLYLTDDGDD